MGGWSIRVWGLGFRAGFRIQGCRAWGVGILGFRVLGRVQSYRANRKEVAASASWWSTASPTWSLGGTYVHCVVCAYTYIYILTCLFV